MPKEKLTPVQRGNIREKALIRGLNKLVEKHGKEIDPVYGINASGEVLIAMKHPKRKITEGCDRFGEELAGLLSQVDTRTGIQPRKGTVLPENGWLYINHFDLEKLLAIAEKQDLENMSLDSLKNIYRHIDSNGYETLEDEILEDKQKFLDTLCENLDYWTGEEGITVYEFMERVKEDRPELFNYQPKIEIEEYFKNHINPYDLWNNDYILGYYPDSSFIVCANSYQDALDEFGEYCKENNLTGYISTEQTREDDFPVNGGEFWLQVPEYSEKIPGRVQFEYSVAYALSNEESRQDGDYFEKGFEKKNEKGSLYDILREAENYGLTSCEGSCWLYNEEPALDRDNIEKGIDSYYSLHIKGQDYNNMSIIKDMSRFLSPEAKTLEP